MVRFELYRGGCRICIPPDSSRPLSVRAWSPFQSVRRCQDHLFVNPAASEGDAHIKFSCLLCEFSEVVCQAILLQINWTYLQR